MVDDYGPMQGIVSGKAKVLPLTDNARESPITSSASAAPALPKKRILVFIVAYNAEKTIEPVLRRIPQELAEFETEVLIIDDASHDETFERGRDVSESGRYPFPLTVLSNPENQGYGGNQKIGFHYAIAHEFDFVVLLHGDGQYAPECLPELLQPLLQGEADAVFGSRMMTPNGARRGGMPLYKYVGNRILSTFQNLMLGQNLSEYHSGYRIYAVDALRRVPFERNTNDFHFDTEVIIQFFFAKLRIVERPIPTYYGDEICHVDGLAYAWHVVQATLLAKAQTLGLYYRRNLDVDTGGQENEHYDPKLHYASPSTMVLDRIREGDKILDVGCAGGGLAEAMSAKGVSVTGVDRVSVPDPKAVGLDHFVTHNLELGPPAVAFDSYSHVLFLDVLEHLKRPERFMEALRACPGVTRDTTIIVSTGNVAFFVTRIMLLLGQFNYGKRGILDLDHTRLFTFASIRRLLEQCGFDVVETHGIPAPFPLAIGDNTLSRALLAMNAALVRLSRSLFSYQIFLVARPRTSLDKLLENAQTFSEARANSGDELQRRTAAGN